MRSSIRGFLFSWGRSFVGKKKKKKGLEGCSIMCSRPYGGREIGEPSIIVKALDQTIKNSFLNIFWDRVKLYISNNSLSKLGFVDWLGYM